VCGVGVGGGEMRGVVIVLNGDHRIVCV
jgi:hypothetical protein